MSAPHGGSRPVLSTASSSLDAPSDGNTRPKCRASQTDTPKPSTNVVDVDDHCRVLECSQAVKQIRFQRIVRHYLAQILYGCKSAYCSTPTCLSFQKRNPTKPARPPTQLTARALAHYLASQANSRAGLCPHELKKAPTSLEIDAASGGYLQEVKDGEKLYSVYPSPFKLAQGSSSARSIENGVAHQKPQNAPQSAPQSIVDAIKQRHQPRKDTKSLSQNLFDSVTMIYAYSKQLPDPVSILQALRTPQPVLGDDVAVQDRPINAMQTSNDTRLQKARDVTFENHTNGEEGMMQPEGNTRSNCRSSQSALQPLRDLRPQSISKEILSNGQQIHRIPYHFRDSQRSQKSQGMTLQTVSEGPTSPKLSIAKTGRKNFTIGGNVAHTGHKSLVSAPNKIVGEEPPPDSSTHTVLPAMPKLDGVTLENLKDVVYNHRRDQTPDDFNFAVDYDANRHFRPCKPSVNRSLFYVLSDPDTLLQSFRENSKDFEASPLPHLDSGMLANSFTDWHRRNGALIFDSLWTVLGSLFVPPPQLQAHKSTRSRSPSDSTDKALSEKTDLTTRHRYLNNLEAAHIVIICIHALTSLVSIGWPHTWAQLRRLRSWGVVLPHAPPNTNAFVHPYLNIIDELEYEPAVRLAVRLCHAIGARTCFEHILEVTEKQDRIRKVDSGAALMDVVLQHLSVVERVALAKKRRFVSAPKNENTDPGWTVTTTFIEWLKTVIIKEWDGSATINKWSSLGTAIMVFDKFHTARMSLNLRDHMFEMPFFNERLNTVKEPLNFMAWKHQPNTLHIFEYPSLFPSTYLVKYFRTINFTSMMSQYDETTRVCQIKGCLEMFLREPHLWLIKSRMAVTLSKYLFIDVSRESPLEDTLDQLWGLEKRMLLKPMKVTMGQEEGEVGADHGGVTYEFFRVVLSEAFKPDHGMFSLDPKTQMTWFQPSTLEPDWKFEMIGILFSLAVYNGITLPVTLPLALYRHLLPSSAPLRDRGADPRSLEFIKDGWLELANGLEQLLTWTDGDVGDLFLRDYTFSYQAFGQRIDHNMDEPYVRPSRATNTSPAVRPEDLLQATTSEAKPVTNANRGEFVHDYITHLTYLSVAPQIDAFRKGFLACLQPKSLHLFSPASLRSLIEGTHHISIPDLRSIAQYDNDYSASHPTILAFWRVVERYSQEDCRHLLEFVTASDRIPVIGYAGLTFHIVKTGDTDMLPTSSTCFGKLYLPAYADEETLKTKLEIAIRNSKGFGVV